jgi:hypothetical protein
MSRRTFNSSREDRLRAERRNLVKHWHAMCKRLRHTERRTMTDKEMNEHWKPAGDACEVIIRFDQQFPEFAIPSGYTLAKGQTPEGCAAQAQEAEANEEWELAAAWYEAAKACSIGHNRRDRYHEAEQRCLDKLLEE